MKRIELQREAIGKQRMQKLQRALQANSVDLLILEDREDITWVCGSGDANIVLVPANNKELPMVFTSKKKRFAERTWKGFKVTKNLLIKEAVERYGTVKVASDSPGSSFSSRLRDNLEIKVQEGFALFWKVASIKDSIELGRIKKGASIAEKLMKFALDNLKTGVMEIDLNDKVMIYGRTLVHEENEKLSLLYPQYTPMVRGVIEDNPAVKITFGPNTAEPHALPRCRRLRKNDVVSVCVVPNIDGYWTELELTTLVGRPSSKLVQYNRVKREVLNVALETCREGVKACEIDEHVRTALRTKGLQDKILHPSGHGIGLKLHEPPILGPSNTLADEPLQSGQVLAVEPGFYFKGRYGFRDSVTILVKRKTAEVLTGFPSESQSNSF